ncbi:MAG: hypothetical protein KBG84_09825 [Planctomycetes bacterium]|nr:hypothetical protein [Planctomycetota bacterium]
MALLGGFTPLSICGCVAKQDGPENTSPTGRAKKWATAQSDLDWAKHHWPNGHLKDEWIEKEGMLVNTEWYESGQKKSQCWMGNPGPIYSIEFWDEDGVLCGAWDGPLHTVLNLSWKNDAEIQESTKSFVGFGPRGVYMRRNSSVTDKGFSSLAAFGDIRWVDITGCPNITQHGCDEFRKALPNCDIRR